MAFLTDYAVRRKGETMAIRYCVMCLADGDKTPAVCVIDIGDGEVEAGYCKPCAETMAKHGHTPRPLPAENRKKWAGKLTDAQRREIVESGELAHKMAARYGVATATIYNLRKKAREDALAAAVAEQGPEAVEEAIEVPVNEAAPEFDDETPVFLLEHEVPIEEIRNMYPGPFWPNVPRDSGMFAGIDRHPHPVTHQEHIEAHDDCDQCPEPVSRNKEALRRVMEEGTEPATVPITLNLTHEKCDSILLALTLAEKAEIVRAELLKRLEAL